MNDNNGDKFEPMGQTLSLNRKSQMLSEKLGEQQLGWFAALTQGHDGQATCVATCLGMWYIVSGGTDCTTRIWKYVQEPYTCYRLDAKLHHKHPVTSVAITDAQATLTFKPGAMGITYDDKGFVEEVSPDGPADKKHISRGDQIVNIGRETYSKDAIFKAEMSGNEYEVTFLKGKKPIVFASTKEDGLCIWNMQTGQVTTKEIPGITDVSCKNEFSDDGHWLLAVAHGNTARLMEALPHGNQSGVYMLKDKCTVQHKEDIRKVQHVPGTLAEGAAVATCADNGVTLWSINGDRLAVLEAWSMEDGEWVRNERKSITCFNLAPKDGGWLLAGSDHEVSVWPMAGGRILHNDSFKPLEELEGHSSLHPHCPPPLVQYEILEGVRDVAIDPDNNFILVSRKDNVSEMLKVAPDDEKKRPAVGSQGPSSKMVQSTLEVTVFEVKHAGEGQEEWVQEIVVSEDPDRDPQLVAALADGSIICWDLEGEDAGIKTSELRSLSRLEMVKPFAVITISFGQIYVFAFGPATTWEEEIERPAKVVYKIALLDWVDMPLEVSRDRIFWIQSLLIVAQMVFFIGSSLVGLPDVLGKWKQQVRRWTRYTEEKRAEEFNGPAHLLEKFCSNIWRLVELLIFGCTTVLAVPTFNSCANVFDCVKRNDAPEKVVALAPGLVCYQGSHLALSVVMFVLILLYAFMLIPHAVVGGDANYVIYPDLFNWGRWQRNAERYATLIFKGFAHPHKEHAFSNAIVDLAVRILLPGLAILTTSMPKFQVSAISLIGLLYFLVSFKLEHFVDRRSCTVVQVTRLMTFFAMLCGALTVMDDGNHKQTATYLLVTSLCMVVLAVPLGLSCWKLKSKNSAVAAIVDNSFRLDECPVAWVETSKTNQVE